MKHIHVGLNAILMIIFLNKILELKKEKYIFNPICGIPNVLSASAPPTASATPEVANPRKTEIAVNKAKIIEIFDCNFM